MSERFERYTEEANKFVRQVALLLGTPEDMNHAESVTAATLHTISERLSPEESMHLIAQLPMWLKAVYVAGWNTRSGTKNYERSDNALENANQYAPRTAAAGFGDDQQAEKNISAVIGALKMYMDEGELNHIRTQLPPDIATVV